MNPGLATAILIGLARCLALVVGAGLGVYTVVKLQSNAYLLAMAGGLVTFGTGGSVVDKFRVDSKIKVALATEPKP